MIDIMFQTLDGLGLVSLILILIVMFAAMYLLSYARKSDDRTRFDYWSDGE